MAKLHGVVVVVGLAVVAHSLVNLLAIVGLSLGLETGGSAMEYLIS